MQREVSFRDGRNDSDAFFDTLDELKPLQALHEGEQATTKEL